MIAAVVPVKDLSSSKSRLLPLLGREAVEQLCLAMLADVLGALTRVPSLERVAVATPDARVARAAREAGAEALERPDAGLNPAIESAAAELAPGPRDGVLAVLGDVAGIRADDVQLLIESVPDRGVALAPSSDGGTSALLRVPRDVIPAAFGPHSAARHRGLAKDAGVPYHELPLPSLAIDLDAPADLEQFLHTEFASARMRALLQELIPERRKP